ncbi:MAG: hypothetical protein Q8R18_02180 [bacterium]|nr:hypothetical protein [bacterium]
MSRDKFLKAYANLPEPEREQVIVIIDGKTYTWNVAFTEISNNTKLGDKIITQLKNLGILK